MNESVEKFCFIDSNIWLYSFVESQNAQKTYIAKSIVRNENIVISVQVINEVCVNLIRKAHFSEEKIRRLVESFYIKYRVVETNKGSLVKASDIRDQHCFSFWDSHVLASALSANVDILYSEDMQDGFVIANTKIVNPFKFLKEHSSVETP